VCGEVGEEVDGGEEGGTTDSDFSNLATDPITLLNPFYRSRNEMNALVTTMQDLKDGMEEIRKKFR
jgi:hypothetical protein